MGREFVTSMDKDGTQEGYDIDLMTKIASGVNIPLIASGRLNLTFIRWYKIW